MTRLTVLGRLTAAEDRTLRGLLLPYGEPGFTDQGRVVATAGTVVMPADLSRMTAALEHPARSGEQAARFTRVWDEADGLHAEWVAEATPAGDRLLAEFRAGTRTGISVELAPFATEGGRLTAGLLDGCAFPVQPAFDSARLSASYVPDHTESVPLAAAPVAPTSPVQPVVVAVPRLHAGGTVSAEELDSAARAASYLIASDGSYTPDELAAAVLAGAGITLPDGVTDPTATPDPTLEDPAVLSASRSVAPRGVPLPAVEGHTPPAGGPAPRRQGERLTAANAQSGEVFRMMAALVNGDSRMSAALADITATTTVAATPPAWLGELWHGVAYQRRVVGLTASAQLTNLRMQGYRWITRPEMADYAGDKAQVPTGTVELDLFPFTAARLAGAHDIDRAIVDFGDSEFIAAYYAAMAESYARLTDAKLAAALVAGATPQTPGAVPTDVDPGTALLADLALSMIDVAQPTFALVAPDVWRSMLLTREQDRMAFLSQTIGFTEGSPAGFSAVPWSGLAAGHVLVGAREAATWYELGNTPLRVDALDIAKGGVDHGCFGYYATVIHDARALRYGAVAGAGA